MSETLKRLPTLKQVHAYLLGEGDLDGFWFGEPDDQDARPRFWWRTFLRDAIAMDALTRPTDPGEDKVETVARALYASMWRTGIHQGPPWEELDEPTRQKFRRHARAAIEACYSTRLPTGEDGKLVKRLRSDAQMLKELGSSPDGQLTVFGFNAMYGSLTKAADRISTLLSEVGVLREALTKIAKPGVGAELSWSDEERADYWVKVATNCRTLARTALQQGERS